VESHQAAVKPSLNDSRAAARALGARNAVTFECVHPLDACREKLSRMALAGSAGHDDVDLTWKYAHFRGRWVQDASGTRLVGHVERSRRAMFVLFLFVVPVALLTLAGLGAAAGASWEGPKLFFLILPAVIAFVGVPLVAMGLGSARVASEIELVRSIGQAIGDPEKYAARWRRFTDD
jgi:hypothetical protein